ncbi:hypothetical protein FOL47_003218 [Perkinsus chesapeaki]|uniref:Uncharacterized protein n=1 Tax=Perkinsus chesapeaki TaxID=330153 RepID=A0A7J6MAD9_PERCH|nr:hypothetical protein FOL47_003218 [Perkinsus chesapeaki]
MIFNRIAAAAILSAIAFQETAAVRIASSRAPSPEPDYDDNHDDDPEWLRNEIRKAENEAKDKAYLSYGETGTIAARSNMYDQLKKQLAARKGAPVQQSSMSEDAKVRLAKLYRLGGARGQQNYKDGALAVRVANDRLAAPSSRPSPHGRRKAPVPPKKQAALTEGLKGLSEDELDAGRQSLRSHLLRPNSRDRSSISRRRSTGNEPVEIGKDIGQLIKEAKGVDMDLAEYWLTHKGKPSEEDIKRAKLEKERQKKAERDSIKRRAVGVNQAVRELNEQAEEQGKDFSSYYFDKTAA